MIQSLEDLKKALENHDAGSDVIDFVVRAIETEKQRGVEEKRAANNEARNIRESLKKVKAGLGRIGYEDEADIEEFVEQLTEKIGSGNPAVTPSGTDSELTKELAKLRRDFERTKRDLAQERQSSQEIKTRASHKAIKAKLSDALRDKVYGHDLLANDLIHSGKVALDEDDESVVFIDGDDRLPFEDGVKRILQTRTDILRNTQTGGARTTAGNQRNSSGKYTRAQIEAMSQDEVKADLAAVRESWAAIRAAEATAG